MKTTIRWIGEVGFQADSDSGHSVVMDGAPESGGQNRGPRPMELVLMGMGGCTAFDVVHILRKSRVDVRDCVAHIEAQRAPTDPKVFTHIHVHFVVAGHGLKTAQVARAIELSAEKYCSASIMLGKSAKITHDFELVEMST